MRMLIFDDSEGLKLKTMEYQAPKTGKPITPLLHHSNTPIIFNLLIATSQIKSLAKICNLGTGIFRIGIQIPFLPLQAAQKGKRIANIGTFFPHRGQKVSQMRSLNGEQVVALRGSKRGDVHKIITFYHAGNQFADNIAMFFLVGQSILPGSCQLSSYCS